MKESSSKGIPDISGTSQVSSFKISSLHSNRFQIGLTQVSPGEIRTNETSSNENSIGEIGITQVASGQVDLWQISPTQINSTQINFNETSLPSSVTLQQFLSSHNFSLQNTTIPTWTEFLTGTTPFNLKIEITDLPTGQLAEGTVTGYDTNGRPTSGTLTLDTEGNGLGWFIDSSPWDNSEFGMTNGETLYRATQGSAAYGHYDLLTTILHELGHLAGLISGTPTYDDRVTNISGTPTFQGNSYTVALTADRSHLANLSQTFIIPQASNGLWCWVQRSETQPTPTVNIAKSWALGVGRSL
jgi:hypothetical protein